MAKVTDLDSNESGGTRRTPTGSVSGSYYNDYKNSREESNRRRSFSDLNRSVQDLTKEMQALRKSMMFSKGAAGSIPLMNDLPGSNRTGTVNRGPGRPRNDRNAENFARSTKDFATSTKSLDDTTKRMTRNVEKLERSTVSSSAKLERAMQKMMGATRTLQRVSTDTGRMFMRAAASPGRKAAGAVADTDMAREFQSAWDEGKKGGKETLIRTLLGVNPVLAFMATGLATKGMEAGKAGVQRSREFKQFMQQRGGRGGRRDVFIGDSPQTRHKGGFITAHQGTVVQATGSPPRRLSRDEHVAILKEGEMVLPTHEKDFFQRFSASVAESIVKSEKQLDERLRRSPGPAKDSSEPVLRTQAKEYFGSLKDVMIEVQDVTLSSTFGRTLKPGKFRQIIAHTVPMFDREFAAELPRHLSGNVNDAMLKTLQGIYTAVRSGSMSNVAVQTQLAKIQMEAHGIEGTLYKPRSKSVYAALGKKFRRMMVGPLDKMLGKGVFKRKEDLGAIDSYLMGRFGLPVTSIKDLPDRDVKVERKRRRPDFKSKLFGTVAERIYSDLDISDAKARETKEKFEYAKSRAYDLAYEPMRMWEDIKRLRRGVGIGARRGVSRTLRRSPIFQTLGEMVGPVEDPIASVPMPESGFGTPYDLQPESQESAKRRTGMLSADPKLTRDAEEVQRKALEAEKHKEEPKVTTKMSTEDIMNLNIDKMSTTGLLRVIAATTLNQSIPPGERESTHQLLTDIRNTAMEESEKDPFELFDTEKEEKRKTKEKPKSLTGLLFRLGMIAGGGLALPMLGRYLIGDDTAGILKTGGGGLVGGILGSVIGIPFGGIPGMLVGFGVGSFIGGALAGYRHDPIGDLDSWFDGVDLVSLLKDNTRGAIIGASIGAVAGALLTWPIPTLAPLGIGAGAVFGSLVGAKSQEILDGEGWIAKTFDWFQLRDQSPMAVTGAIAGGILGYIVGTATTGIGGPIGMGAGMFMGSKVGAGIGAYMDMREQEGKATEIIEHAAKFSHKRFETPHEFVAQYRRLAERDPETASRYRRGGKIYEKYRTEAEQAFEDERERLNELLQIASTLEQIKLAGVELTLFKGERDRYIHNMIQQMMHSDDVLKDYFPGLLDFRERRKLREEQERSEWTSKEQEEIFRERRKLREEQERSEWTSKVQEEILRERRDEERQRGIISRSWERLTSPDRNVRDWRSVGRVPLHIMQRFGVDPGGLTDAIGITGTEDSGGPTSRLGSTRTANLRSPRVLKSLGDLWSYRKDAGGPMDFPVMSGDVSVGSGFRRKAFLKNLLFDYGPSALKAMGGPDDALSMFGSDPSLQSVLQRGLDLVKRAGAALLDSFGAADQYMLGEGIDLRSMLGFDTGFFGRIFDRLRGVDHTPVEAIPVQKNRLMNEPGFLKKVANVAKSIGTHPAALLAVLKHESSLNPSARNPRSSATGLMQWTTGRLRDVAPHLTPDRIRAMDWREQLQLVQKDLGRYRNRISSVEDLYASIFAPAFIGRPSSTAMYRSGTSAYQANRELDLNQDGIITKGEAAHRPRGFFETMRQWPVWNELLGLDPEGRNVIETDGIWPSTDDVNVITSAFGPRKHPVSGKWHQHSGIDLSARGGSEGKPVISPFPGEVIFAGQMGGGGNTVRIKHPSGIETVYMHLQSISSRRGDQVVPGEKIGKIGKTGRVTGPHLHFEMWKGERRRGEAIDPIVGLGSYSQPTIKPTPEKSCIEDAEPYIPMGRAGTVFDAGGPLDGQFKPRETMSPLMKQEQLARMQALMLLLPEAANQLSSSQMADALSNTFRDSSNQIASAVLNNTNVIARIGGGEGGTGQNDANVDSRAIYELETDLINVLLRGRAKL